jgi:hypothetical protein
MRKGIRNFLVQAGWQCPSQAAEEIFPNDVTHKYLFRLLFLSPSTSFFLLFPGYRQFPACRLSAGEPDAYARVKVILMRMHQLINVTFLPCTCEGRFLCKRGNLLADGADDSHVRDR